VQKPQRTAQAHGKLLTRDVQMDNKKYLMQRGNLIAVMITGYFVGVRQVQFEFMVWINFGLLACWT
jgi:hypothetical protein